MGDLHEAVFRWPHTEPTTVILTGTFDQWSSSIHLTKGETGFEGIAKLPWEEKIAYKFIVDGQWIIHEDQPTETDHSGNINNIYTSPPKPPPAMAIEPIAKAIEPVNGSANGSVTASDKVAEAAEQVHDTVVTPVVEADTTVVEQIKAPAVPAVVESVIAETSKGQAEPETSLPVKGAKPTAIEPKEPTAKPDTPAAAKDILETTTDIAGTIAARDGTSTTLGYVASGLGAAIQSVVGVDPINADKIAIETPKPDARFVEPDSVVNQQVSEPIPEPEPTLVAPGVPISLVPVTAPKDNTVVDPPPPAAQPTSEVAAPVPTETITPDQPSRQTIVTVSATEPTAANESLAPEAPAAAAAAAPVSETPKPNGPEPKIDGSSPTNGIAATSTSAAHAVTPPVPSEKPAAPTSTPAPSAPSTPAKNHQHSFPSSESPGSSTANNSPSSSKFGTASSRKKKSSIFGKFKSIFGHEKEKEKEKGKK